MRALRSVLVAVVCATLAAGCGGAGSPGAADDAVEANATVERIVDGDTVVLTLDGVDEKVRLIGIDTPESVDRNRPVMCFGKEATKHLDELIPPGTAIRLERDVEARDRYGRLLGYLYRSSDGLFVNLAMTADGYARQYTFPPNVEHTDEFGDAARTARTEQLGLWAACDKPFEE